MTGAPAHADVVVVGAGILGCSIAWHLLLLDARIRVVVLDRQGVATQATSQAAALMTRARSSAAATAMVRRTYDVLRELEAVLAEPLPFVKTGALHVAGTGVTGQELASLVSEAETSGLPAEWPDNEALARLVPWLAIDRVVSAAFFADDGTIDPAILAHAYARAARNLGAHFSTGNVVNGIMTQGGRVTGVDTPRGRIAAATVVVAAGAWSNRLTMPLGCGLPTAPVCSEYWITAADPAFPRGHPVVILPDARAYTRPEVGGLLFGLRGTANLSVDPRALPADIAGYAIPDRDESADTLAECAEGLVAYCPALGRVGIAHAIEGLSTYTPDGAFVLGAAPGVDGLFVATGCCGAGIAASGGIGLAIAGLVLGHETALDLPPFAPDRFGAVDPFDPAFRRRCAQARARKTAG